MKMSAENRRPIKARSLAVMQSLASLLARTNVTPNQISVMSVVFSLLVPLGLGIWGSSWTGVLIALAGIQLRLLCNLIDGMVAVEGGKRSPLGDVYNEFPDRISDTVILLGFAFASREQSYLYMLAWVACFGAVLTAYVRVLGASLGTKHYFSGPMAKQHRMALLSAALLVLPILGVTLTNLLVAAIFLVVIAGTVVTCARRLKQIAAELRSRSSFDNAQRAE
jgi:phosphatidylglycerophosphate synthase